MTDRERAALAVVREVFSGAEWVTFLWDRLALKPTRHILRWDRGAKAWILSASCEGYWPPDNMRAVLRALDILNGESE